MSGIEREVTLRTELRPGDLGLICYLHATLYAREQGFDETFEAYVAAPLAQMVLARSPRERLWVAERQGQVVGCVAVVAASLETAQLRWLLLVPEARGSGLGRRLLQEAVTFARHSGYRSIILWTVSSLRAAAGLYGAAGFTKVEENPGKRWGVDVIEEKYELFLREGSDRPPG